MQISLFRSDRNVLRPLFALAEDSAVRIEQDLPLGEILVARDGDLILGHVQIVEIEAPERDAASRVFELKTLAVLDGYRIQGIGRALVDAAIAHCRTRSGRRLLVATAAADIANLRFYQRLGFRMFRIVQDAFTAEHGYPEPIVIDGIELRDQVWFELWL